MNPVVDEAFKRAIPQAIITGLGTLLIMLPQTDDWKLIVSAAGVAALGPLGFRGVGESWYDTKRAEAGKAIAGDVPMASDKLDVSKVG